MKNSLDKTSKTDIIHFVEETPMVDFQALRETVLAERAAKADADAKLASELNQAKPAVSFKGADAVDDMMNWLDQ